MDVLLGSSWLLPSAERPQAQSTPKPAEQPETSEKPKETGDNSPFDLEKSMSESLLKIVDDAGEAAKQKERGENWLLDEDDVDMDDGATLVAEDENVAKPNEEKESAIAEEKEENKENVCPVQSSAKEGRTISLLDFLCSKLKCSVNELYCYLQNVPMRRKIVADLRKCELITSHIRPPLRNFHVRCDDITCRAANAVYAMNGYLNITVRQYYYIKHNRNLRQPFLPCIIMFGGHNHRSFFPLEVIRVRLEK